MEKIVRPDQNKEINKEFMFVKGLIEKPDRLDLEMMGYGIPFILKKEGEWKVEKDLDNNENFQNTIINQRIHREDISILRQSVESQVKINIKRAIKEQQDLYKNMINSFRGETLETAEWLFEEWISDIEPIIGDVLLAQNETIKYVVLPEYIDKSDLEEISKIFKKEYFYKIQKHYCLNYGITKEEFIKEPLVKIIEFAKQNDLLIDFI